MLKWGQGGPFPLTGVAYGSGYLKVLKEGQGALLYGRGPFLWVGRGPSELAWADDVPRLLP